MKNLGKIGLIPGSRCLMFGLSVMLIVVPASESAKAMMDQIWQNTQLAEGETYADVPCYTEALEASEKGVDFVGLVFLVPILLPVACIGDNSLTIVFKLKKFYLF